MIVGNADGAVLGKFADHPLKSGIRDKIVPNPTCKTRIPPPDTLAVRAHTPQPDPM